MCGRYFLELKALWELEKRIDYVFERELLIAKDYFPSNTVPIIIDDDNKRVIKKAKWGFKAFDDRLVINARNETLLEKPLFKNEFINHRCIIPASGFYEWDEHKHKFTFENNGHHLMMMAGVYRIVENQVEMVIITTKANKSMQGIHERMPLILPERLIDNWLRNNHPADILKRMPEPLIITSGFLQNSLF